MTADDAVDQAISAFGNRGWKDLDIQAVANLAAAILIADRLQDIESSIGAGLRGLK